ADREDVRTTLELGDRAHPRYEVVRWRIHPRGAEYSDLSAAAGHRLHHRFTSIQALAFLRRDDNLRPEELERIVLISRYRSIRRPCQHDGRDDADRRSQQGRDPGLTCEGFRARAVARSGATRRAAG